MLKSMTRAKVEQVEATGHKVAPAQAIEPEWDELILEGFSERAIAQAVNRSRGCVTRYKQRHLARLAQAKAQRVQVVAAVAEDNWLASVAGRMAALREAADVVRSGGFQVRRVVVEGETRTEYVERTDTAAVRTLALLAHEAAEQMGQLPARGNAEDAAPVTNFNGPVVVLYKGLGPLGV